MTRLKDSGERRLIVWITTDFDPDIIEGLIRNQRGYIEEMKSEHKVRMLDIRGNIASLQNIRRQLGRLPYRMSTNLVPVYTHIPDELSLQMMKDYQDLREKGLSQEEVLRLILEKDKRKNDL